MTANGWQPAWEELTTSPSMMRVNYRGKVNLVPVLALLPSSPTEDFVMQQNFSAQSKKNWCADYSSCNN